TTRSDCPMLALQPTRVRDCGAVPGRRRAADVVDVATAAAAGANETALRTVSVGACCCCAYSGRAVCGRAPREFAVAVALSAPAPRGGAGARNGGGDAAVEAVASGTRGVTRAAAFACAMLSHSHTISRSACSVLE